MAKINNEQRKAFADIIHANGRASEFYAKYGQSAVAKNRAKAQEISDKMDEVNEKVKALEKELSEAKEALEKKHSKAVDAVKKGSLGYEKQLRELGYTRSWEYTDNGREYVLAEDTSRTNAEYEMFKKRALATIWGSDTLEEANKAIQDYLNLEK